MKSLSELKLNLAHFTGKDVDDGLIKQPDRRLHIEEWCSMR